MSGGEPIKWLKLSTDPRREDEAMGMAVSEIERFLDQIDGYQGADIIRELLDGTGLVELHGEETGRELAAQRLALLAEDIGRAASELSGLGTIEFMVGEELTTTTNELGKLTPAKVNT